MSDADPLLARRRRRAEERLAQVAGDVTLCVIGRSGESFPGIKYHEGAAAAVMDVARRATRMAIEQALVEALAAWRTALDGAHRRLGPDWIAYRQGGVDELDAFARELAAVRGSSEPGVTRRRSDGTRQGRIQEGPGR